MRDIFCISDTHAGHENFLRFMDEDGKRIRHEFESLQEIDGAMIERWNSRVKHDAIVYHLGDVAICHRDYYIKFMDCLNGSKRLILGNHDTMGMEVYKQHFQKISSWRQFGTDITGPDITFTTCHYPLHPFTIGKRTSRDTFGGPVNFCVHGHLHRMMIDDPRYINVCVENIDYTPIHLDELLTTMRERLDAVKELLAA